MPSKGKRIASKRSTSNHKSKRTRGPSGIPQGQSVIQSERITTDSSPETRIGSEVEQPQINPTRSESRSRNSVYNFVGPEVRRILALSTTIMTALVAISFFIQ